MRRLFPILVAVVGLLAASAANGQPPRAAAERALAGYETRLTRQSLEALGPDWERTLMDIARDPSARPLVRIRALSGLGFSRASSVADFLKEAIAARQGASDPAALLELEQALRSLAVVQGPEAGETLAPFLAHASPDIRAAAGHALMLSGAPQATERVQSRLKAERDPVARTGLERSLSVRAPAR